MQQNARVLHPLDELCLAVGTHLVPTEVEPQHLEAAPLLAPGTWVLCEA